MKFRVGRGSRKVFGTSCFKAVKFNKDACDVCDAFLFSNYSVLRLLVTFAFAEN